MKNLKKLVSVVLTLALLVSTFATSALAISYADVETTSTRFEAIDILSGLGILKGDELGNFNPKAEIKRSEVAAVIARALGSEDAAQGSTGYSAFADVSADHWAVGYINWAAQQGIVNGRDAQTFDPDASVKYQEVIKMLVAALGYEPLAQKKGGYPTGYMVIASSNAITKGISLAGDANAPREIVAQAVYNALEVPLMDASIITASGDDEYAIYNGKGDNDKRTVLSYYLEIAKVEAQVIATTRSAITGTKINIDKDDEEEVKIDITSVVGYDSLIEDDDSYYNGEYYEGKKLQALCGGTGAESLLGYNVIAYVGKDADEKDRIFAITPDTKKTDILEAYDWVSEISEADEDGIVVVGYYVDGDTTEDVEEIDVDEDAVVVVNGTVDEDYDLVGLTAANDVVFMDIDDDEVYDYAFVKKYVYDVVEEVDAEEGIITVETNGDIDVTDEEIRYTLTFNGEAIEFTELQENDVLNIIADAEDLEDASYVDIVVSRDTVEGTITREEDDDGVTKYVIDGTGYECVDGVSVALKDEGTFYLTIDGKIAKAVATATAKDYAFVTEIEEYDEFGTTYYVQMVTDNGAVREYAVASSVKVKIGDATAVTYKRTGANVQADIFAEDGVLGAKVVAQATEAAAEATIPYRFVTYTLNANGEISALNIAKQEKDTNKTVFDADVLTGKYAPNTGKFCGYFYGEDTKLFAVAVSENRDGYVFDTDDVTIMAFDALDVDEDNYTGWIFSTDKNKNFGAAVITNEVAPSGIDAPLAIVKAVLSGENAAGENAKGYKVLQAGKEVVIYEGEDFEGEELVKGDIFYYSLDAVGDIKKLTKVYDVETNALVATEYDEKNEIGFVIGLATYDGGSQYLTIEDGEGGKYDLEFAKGVEGTFALVDTAKAGYSSYITALSSAAGLKASKDRSKYVTVAKVVDRETTDAIQFLTEFDDRTENFGWDGEPEYDLDWNDSAVEEETEAPSEEPSEEAPSEEVPSEEVPSEEVPSEEVPSEEVPSEEPSEEVPSEEVPSEEPSVEA